MKFLENTEEILISMVERLGLAWWIEIVTANPCCTYYFGPFVSEKQAKLFQSGYIEYLQQEEAQILAVNIKRSQPEDLTICENKLQQSITAVDT